VKVLRGVSAPSDLCSSVWACEEKDAVQIVTAEQQLQPELPRPQFEATTEQTAESHVGTPILQASGTIDAMDINYCHDENVCPSRHFESSGLASAPSRSRRPLAECGNILPGAAQRVREVKEILEEFKLELGRLSREAEPGSQPFSTGGRSGSWGQLGEDVGELAATRCSPNVSPSQAGSEWNLSPLQPRQKAPRVQTPQRRLSEASACDSELTWATSFLDITPPATGRRTSLCCPMAPLESVAASAQPSALSLSLSMSPTSCSSASSTPVLSTACSPPQTRVADESVVELHTHGDEKSRKIVTRAIKGEEDVEGRKDNCEEEVEGLEENQREEKERREEDRVRQKDVGEEKKKGKQKESEEEKEEEEGQTMQLTCSRLSCSSDEASECSVIISCEGHAQNVLEHRLDEHASGHYQGLEASREQANDTILKMGIGSQVMAEEAASLQLAVSPMGQATSEVSVRDKDHAFVPSPPSSFCQSFSVDDAAARAGEAIDVPPSRSGRPSASPAGADCGVFTWLPCTVAGLAAQLCASGDCPGSRALALSGAAHRLALGQSPTVCDQEASVEDLPAELAETSPEPEESFGETLEVAADDKAHLEEPYMGVPPASESILADSTLLRLLQQEDLERSLSDEGLPPWHLRIHVPPGVRADRRVRVMLQNMELEAEIPDGAMPGEVVVCTLPLEPPLSAARQLRILRKDILESWLCAGWMLEDGHVAFDEERKRQKVRAYRRLRGRCMAPSLSTVEEV